jgi:hypothetical protein
MSEEQLAAASAAKSEYNREWYLLNNHKHKARVNAAKRLACIIREPRDFPSNSDEDVRSR